MNFLHVSSGSLFESCLRARGLDPALAAPDAAERAQLASLANRHLRHAWEYQLWPQLMVTRRVRYREDWTAGAYYAEGDQVWNDNAYWEALVDGPTEQPVLVDGLHQWKRADNTMLLSIDYDAYGIDELDLGAGVFALNPDKVEDAQGLPCIRTAYGCAVRRLPGRATPPQPFVRFRPCCPRLSWTDWAANATYKTGDACYRSGESWVALVDAPTAAPGEDETAWALQRCPRFFEEYVVAAVAAEYAQDDDGRAPQWSRANKLLQDLADRYCGQIRERRRAIVRVHR